ncbi:MAG TPA: hypothetical protein VFP74_02640 [Pseudolabrys sp.]|nr:hypothetical protein [Pseudolabrys sp.]
MPTEADTESRPLLRALTRDGVSLPVIDVTDPRFHVADDAASLRALFERAADEARRHQRMPQFIMRFMLRRAARQSLILRALFGGEGSFLDGLTTYVMKLGADHLPPPFDSPVDKRVASSAQLKMLRLRTQQVATLLADALGEALGAEAAVPLHLVNIAGGPAIDSMNALILLRQRGADLKRPVVIHVLDRDDAGPFFGRNALGALTADGAPLNRLDITFDHRHYDWNDTATLEGLLRETEGGIVGASSEGGVFEYGDDDAVVANLRALRAGNVRAVTGSVTGNTERHRRNITVSRFKLHPRGLEEFGPLAARAGWRVARSEPAQLSDQVSLTPV